MVMRVGMKQATMIAAWIPSITSWVARPIRSPWAMLRMRCLRAFSIFLSKTSKSPFSGGGATDLLAAALYYSRLGLAVLPVHSPTDKGCSCGNPKCRSIGKHPRTKTGFKEATTDQKTIEDWWSRFPEANIGLVTGNLNGFFVLDVDPKNGGNESFKEVLAKLW